MRMLRSGFKAGTRVFTKPFCQAQKLDRVFSASQLISKRPNVCLKLKNNLIIISVQIYVDVDYGRVEIAQINNVRYVNSYGIDQTGMLIDLGGLEMN